MDANMVKFGKEAKWRTSYFQFPIKKKNHLNAIKSNDEFVTLYLE